MSTIASYIDLSRYSGPIYDQGQQGSCKANQVISAIELSARMYGVELQPLSRQQLYNDTREAQLTFNRDSGSAMGVAEKVAMEKGIAFESSFTYGLHNLYEHTSANVDAEAATQKVTSVNNFGMAFNPLGLAYKVGEQLMQGKPVMLDTWIREGFGSNITWQDYSDNNVRGGHAVLIVGIDMVNQNYKIQNSWGSEWGNDGYATISWQCFPNLPRYDYPSTNYSNQDLMRVGTLNGFAGVDTAWTTERTQVGMLYAAVLERCADKGGLNFWAGWMKNGMSEKQIIQFMFDGSEAQAKYGSMSNEQFVTEVYDNVLDRAPDVSGLAFYTSLLDNNVLTRVDILADIIHNVDTGKDTKAANDRLENLEILSTNYAVTYQIDNSPVTGYNYIQTITDNADTVQAALIGLHTEIFGY